MEIQVEQPFTKEQTTLIDMHSVVNVISIVQYEVLKLSEYVRDQGVLNKVVDLTLQFARDLREPEKAYAILEDVDVFFSSTYEALNELEQKITPEQEKFFIETKANLEGIFGVIKTRVSELLSRRDNVKEWVDHDIDKLKKNFLNVFQAIEQNSHGAYHIVFNLAKHERGDYFVNFEIGSYLGQVVKMPIVFQDVMRDLIANARKYTVPGGKITAGLNQDEIFLRFVVEDTGVGIPKNEILQVVSFGVRGSNVGHRTTRGGGFGLTKAYMITKMFDGKMWIDSPVLNDGSGTKIKIEIPMPS